jgi:hypothetical protein
VFEVQKQQSTYGLLLLPLTNASNRRLLADLIMAPTNPLSLLAEAAAEAATKEKKKKQKEPKKAKTNQQKQFIESTMFDDVAVDESNPSK